MHACPRLARAAGSVPDRLSQRPRRCFQYPRSLVNLGSGGRVSWPFGWSRRRPSCNVGCPCPSLRSRSGASRALACVGCAGDAGRAAKAAPPAQLQMQARQPRPSGRRAAAATACATRGLPQWALPRRCGRWRGRAPYTAGPNLALPRRGQLFLAPRQGYEKFGVRSRRGVESRRGDPSRHTNPGRASFGSFIQKVNLHPASPRLSFGRGGAFAAAGIDSRRAGTLADALDASAQPPGCPRDRPRSGSTLKTKPSGSQVTHCEEAPRQRSHGLLLLAEARRSRRRALPVDSKVL